MSPDGISETSKRPVRVLFGNHVDTINRVYARSIESALKHRYTFSFRSCFTNDEILERSRQEKIDVHVLVLNNIMLLPALDDSESRRDVVLDLVRHLKKTSHATVIALWGWNFEDLEIEEKIRSAGADFCFPLPVDVKVLVEAVEMCLY
jgi:hypothetical protein